MAHDGTDMTGQDETGWDRMGWDRGQDRQDKPLQLAEGTGHSNAVAEPSSHSTAQLLNPSKAAQIPRGERWDGAGSRGQARNDDRVASGDMRPRARSHSRAGTFPSILHKAVISSHFVLATAPSKQPQCPHPRSGPRRCSRAGKRQVWG